MSLKQREPMIILLYAEGKQRCSFKINWRPNLKK